MTISRAASITRSRTDGMSSIVDTEAGSVKAYVDKLSRRVQSSAAHRFRNVENRSPNLSLALDLADVADEITMARYASVDLVIETKPDATPVSDADMAVEAALRSRLSE